MPTWIVNEGRVEPLDFGRLPARDRYGWDWIIVEAADATEALAAAEAHDRLRGGDTEQQLFAAGYREGVFGLPGDALVGVAEVAERAGVKPDTVHAWRQRHADFPDPVETLAMGPVWYASDIDRWLAVPRRAGRPRRGE